MKTVCIYHGIDEDGWMSAAIVKHWFIKNHPDGTINNELIKEAAFMYEDANIDFIGYNYGQPIPDLSEYDKVIMCDVSFPKEEMSKLWHNLPTKLIWIDHHISAIKDNDDLVFDGVRDTKFAACELTWKYFFPKETMPEIVRLLGMYDSFRHKGTDEETKVLEFQYGARQCIANYEEAYNYLTIELNSYLPNPNNYDREENPIYKIWNNGKSIYQYLCTEAKQIYKIGFNIKLYYYPNMKGCTIFGEFNFICINKERFNPINFGIDYHKDGYDGCACFHYANGVWNFSLYNDNGKVDCSQIAKHYGGGGHKGAAGFRLENTEFLELICNKSNNHETNKD